MRRDFTPGVGDLLCEQCGYLLNGLPPEGNCPECGKSVAESTVDSPRRPPLWEAGFDRGVARFQLTALSVLRNPKAFFRLMTAIGDSARSKQFGRLAILPAIVFNTKTVIMHAVVMQMLMPFLPMTGRIFLLPLTPVLVAATWFGVYLAVVRLTTLESKFWGMRLPSDVVRRALHYDAVHVTVASLLPWLVTLVYLCMVIADESRFAAYTTVYLFTLSGTVVVAAIYLFVIYATSMRALMYANR